MPPPGTRMAVQGRSRPWSCAAPVPQRFHQRAGGDGGHSRHRRVAAPCANLRSAGAIIAGTVIGPATSGANPAGIALPGTAPAKVAPHQSGQIAVTAPAMTGTEKPVAFDLGQTGPGRRHSE